MQIKPAFKEYKELSRTPFIKDDTGNQYSLVHYVGTEVQTDDGYPHGHPGTKTITTEGYKVMSDTLHKWSNDCTSYEEILFWSKVKKLEEFKVDGFLLKEKFTGTNGYFPKSELTMNTSFLVYPLSE